MYVHCVECREDVVALYGCIVEACELVTEIFANSSGVCRGSG